MTLGRKPPIKDHRISLKGLSQEAAVDCIEKTVNNVLDHLRIRTIALPEESFSDKPKDGELLFDGSALYIVVHGTYRQIWPCTCSGGGGVTEIGDGMTEWPLRTSALYTVLQMTSGSATLVEAVPGVAGSLITVLYLEINNGASQARWANLQFSTATGATRLFRALVPPDGGTIVQNFIGAEVCNNTPGSSLYVGFSTSGVGTTTVTIGYLQL